MQLSPEDITHLSPQERLDLIARLWDSLTDDETPLPPAQRDELERRLATLDQDRAHAVAWETLKADLERRCP
jgi:putative addiction module component (TIGR02574 family)